jgi:hypothetical protein
VAAFVPVVDVGADRADELFEAGEGSAPDRLSTDDPGEDSTRFSQEPLFGVKYNVIRGSWRANS